MMDGHGRWCHLVFLSCTGTFQDYSPQSLPADRRVWLNQGYLQAAVSFMHILRVFASSIPHPKMVNVVAGESSTTLFLAGAIFNN